MRWERVPGVRVEPLGAGWAAFSPLSGDTLLISTESAAILEILADGPSEEVALCDTLALDVGQPSAAIAAALAQAREGLVAAGLVRLR
jgi:PqqD family protein of HPr-rel-A system